MNWLNIRTGYSFKHVFGHVDEIMSRLGKKCTAAGIADQASTFGHVIWKNACKGANINPIYGVRLMVSDEPKGKAKNYRKNEMTFIATTPQTLQEIYYLVDLAHKQFYYHPRITHQQMNDTSPDMIVLSGISPELERFTRGIHLQMSPDLPWSLKREGEIMDPVACLDNWFPRKEDKTPYETFAANNFSFERKTTPMHIVTDDEWVELFPDYAWALSIRDELSELASGVELPKAPFISVGPNAAEVLKKKCKAACRSQPDLDSSKIKKRLRYELDLIIEKGFSDYFLVVADLVEYAKTKMVVGPARGSSAGSLVCYLLGITTINPLDYDLLFERFIDINRTDLPDIDIDFQDTKRDLVIKYLQKKYGIDNVAQIGNISKLKPKSTINRAAKALCVPTINVDEFKNSIAERPEGDARERYAIEDAYESDLGRAFLSANPNMAHVSRLEGHPAHTSVHAAGVIVCTKPVVNFCGINSKENNIAMIDKRDAEELNLLKIDALGLITLSILGDICDQLGKPYQWLETIPLDDKKTYKMLNSQNSSGMVGIFQMEGASLRTLADGMEMKDIGDLAALSALCRPGPLMSGAADRYIKQKSGEAQIIFMSTHKRFKKWTADTMGNIVYQEQIMGICREMGKMPWPDVIKVRKLMGKSMGDEAFSQYKKQFIKGARKNGAEKEEAETVWDAMKNFGQYGFNKSHAVAYAIISYLTAYMKRHHPLEFAVGLLNHSSNPQNGIKILRMLKEDQGIKHLADGDKWFKNAQPDWSTKGGKLLAGFLSVDGIGPANAKAIMKCRSEGTQLPIGVQNKINAGDTPYKYLYPARQLYGDYFKGKKSKRAMPITHIAKEAGSYIFIGCLTKKFLKNINDQAAVSRRKGEVKEGPQSYINATFEDDTGEITGIVSRFKYEDIGNVLINDAQEGKDWFLIEAKAIRNEYKTVFIEKIQKITRKN